MVKAIMHGCNGKMGQVISGLVKEDDVIEIVAGIDKFTGIENPYPVFTSLAECDVQADVVIDFSNAAAVDELLDVCVEKTLPVVLCTTGLSEEQLAKVKEAGEKVAVLRSANMSLGVNLLMKLLKDAAKVLAPAGFNEAMADQYVYNYDRSHERKKREKNEIGIVAVRGGTIVGQHDVIFAGADEVIEFHHTAYSKAIFGKGAVEAAKFLAGKPAGMYDMSDVIGL